jgi:hypothetical protein
MVKAIVIIFIFLLLPYFSIASTKKVTRSAFSFVYKKPNTLSRVLYIFREGSEVMIISQAKGWAKVRVNNKYGYIHIRILSNRLLPVNENIYNILIKKLKSDDLSSIKKDFSEEDELSAASKGFSEEDELSAASKGFSKKGVVKKKDPSVRVSIILKKYSFFNKKGYIKDQLAILKILRKYKSPKRK